MVLLIPPHPHREGQADPHVLEVAHDAACGVDLSRETVDQLAQVGLEDEKR